MPDRVGRMEQRPVLADARPRGVERRRERGLDDGGRSALPCAHDDAAAEAHPPRSDVVQTRVTPVALDGGERMTLVEAIDAGTKERSDARPLGRDDATGQGKPDARVG